MKVTVFFLSKTFSFRLFRWFVLGTAVVTTKLPSETDVLIPALPHHLLPFGRFLPTFLS